MINPDAVHEFSWWLFFSMSLSLALSLDIHVMLFFFSSSLSQTQLVGIGQPTRASLLLTLVVNGPTRARFSRLAHNLVKFPPAGNTEEKRRKKKETTKKLVEENGWMCAGPGVIGRCLLRVLAFSLLRSVQSSIGGRQLCAHTTSCRRRRPRRRRRSSRWMVKRTNERASERASARARF